MRPSIRSSENNPTVKNAFPNSSLEICQKGCGYFLKFLADSKASQGGKFIGVCLCVKTGKGDGPKCQQ